MENREIKFRGLTDGEAPTWVYGCLVNNLWNYSELAKYPKGTPVCEIIVSDSVDDYAELEDKELNVRVIPDSVGQYTGLKDKNGKEIYEGDIVKCHDHPTGVSDTIGRVYWKDGKWMVSWSMVDLGDYGTAWIEVIGNIHQNPSLLTQ